ncbi:MAG: hypothetical protein OXU20_06950 [Myxococcales bacterium]|nr:hypothetical protein [Myxococcales bacterium]MDD9965620.1 hypothetical protein [Myxococcales bacterium]
MSPRRGRKAETPRLRDLRPRAVALEVEDAVINHLSSLALQLSPGVTAALHDHRTTTGVVFVVGPVQRGQVLHGYRSATSVPDDAEEVIPSRSEDLQSSDDMVVQLDARSTRPLGRVSGDEWRHLVELWGQRGDLEEQAQRYWLGPQTDLGLSVLDLVVYAQTGRADIDRSWHEFAISMIPLHMTPLDDHAAFDGVETSEVGTPLGVVMVAADARDRIAGGEDLEARHLYTLASIGKQRFGHLLQAADVPPPEISARPAKWAASTAKAWLVGRGVPGL